MSEDKKSVIGFVAIVLIMIGALAYGLSAVRNGYVDGPKETMTEACKKLWSGQGEEVAVKNGC